jgi:DNA polymerase-3 subunit delta'
MLGRAPTMMAGADMGSISSHLPWQSEKWAKLVEQMNAQQLPHALLLSGVQFCGKAHFALALARLLLCAAPSAGHNCGECQACVLSQNGSHGDFQTLEPEGTSRVIKVDQVRGLVEFTTKTASLGRRKVAILSPAESMHRSSANALLKSLEEPSPDTFIILVCHRLQGLPATIRSRCQVINFLMPTPDQALPWLDQLTGARADSQNALDLSGGRALLAASLYKEARLPDAEAVQASLEALGTGEGTVQDLGSLMADAPIEDLLQELHRYLQGQIHAMDSRALTSDGGRRAFGLLDGVVQLQRVVASGANPNRQLLLDGLSARFEMVLP